MVAQHGTCETKYDGSIDDVVFFCKPLHGLTSVRCAKGESLGKNRTRRKTSSS